MAESSQHSILLICLRRAVFGIGLLLLMSCGKNTLPPEQTLTVATASITAGALSDQGEAAVVGSLYHGISYWRLSDSERLFDWRHKAGADTALVAADFSAEGAWALTAAQYDLVLWNTKTGEAPRYWRAPGEILSAQLTAGGNLALLGLGDNTAVLFDIRKGGVIHTLNHNGPVLSVHMTADGKLAATGSSDYSAVTWDLQNNKPLAKMRHNDEVQLVALSPDGNLVLSVSKYDKAVVWRSTSGEIIAEIPLAAGRVKRGLRFTAARFSSDNQYLLTGQPNQIVTLWPLDNLEKNISWQVVERSFLKPSGAAILDVAFTNDANRFYALASNGQVYRLSRPH